MRVRDRLRTLVTAPVVREAIFVASPDLERSIDLWLTSPETDRGQAIERGLLRYVVRMASRPTPFGLFAGNGTGTIGAQTQLTVDPPAACRRHTRLDMDYLARLADVLARDSSLTNSLTFSLNTSLHRSAGRWHYVESIAAKDGRTHHLVAVDDSDALRQTLERARDGATRAALAAALVDDDISIDDARAYVDELVASQILVPDLECPVTGDEPLGHLIAGLRRSGGESAADRLTAAAAALSAIDASPIGIAAARYEELARSLEPFGVPITPARLFQVDLVKPAAVSTLAAAVVDEVARGIHLLHRLTPKPIDDPLARLRAAFTRRYEAREVPLFEVLDEETGIASALGEGRDRESSPLLEDINFGGPVHGTVPWTRLEKGLLRRLGDALTAGRTELTLTAHDFDELETKHPPPLPSAYAAMATVVATPASLTAPRPDFRVLLKGVSGPSGALLLGRFCHADPTLTDYVVSHIHAEEATAPDAVFAEIVHLPEGRIGNIVARPLLRDYEIVYLGRSGAPIEQRLPIDDLRLSVVGHRFVLRSERLGRRVIPRLTSAHNYMAQSVATYRFLCLLQADGCASGVTWSWGPLDALPFLPRLTTGRLVLARARWRVTKDEIRTLCDATGTDRYEALQRWRQTRRIPRWVVLADYDNMLVVDLENIVAVDSLLQMLRDRDDAALLECYPEPDQLCAEGPDGLFAHEVVIPFTQAAQPAPSEPAGPGLRRPIEAVAAVRQSLPGSQWIYAQLYAGPAAADGVLMECVGPISRKLVAQGAADRWFFIRYLDPSPHVRWRLRATSAQARTTIRRAVEKAVADLHGRGLVHRLVFDTYEREIERYGGPEGIDLAEELFCIDSEAVIDVLSAIAAESTRHSRWQSAVIGVDALLADFNLDVQARLDVMRRVRKDWGTQMLVTADVGRDIGRRFRALHGELAHLLERQFDPGDPMAAIDHVFAARSERQREVVARLAALEKDQRLGAPLSLLADSYVHMHVNRLFRADPNLHEVVICDFLVQLYTRQLARTKHAG